MPGGRLSAVASMDAAVQGRRVGLSANEALDEETVPQAAITHRQGLPVELGEDRSHDARTGEDHLGAGRLESDDLAPFVGTPRAIEVDLAIDLVEVENRSLYDVRVVLRQAEFHRGQVGRGAADGHDGG